MAELVRHRNGQWGLYSPSTGVEVISDEEAAAIQQSNAGVFGRSFGAGITDAVGAAIEYGLPQFTRVQPDGTKASNIGQRIQETNDPQQAARRAQRGGLATAGNIAAFGAEVVAPGAAATRLGRLIGDGAESLAQRSARRVGDVIQDNRAQITNAAEAQPQFRSVRPDRPDVPPARAAGRVDGSINAAENPALRTADGSDVITSSQADALNMPLTNTQRKLLDAWESGDMAAVQAAEDAVANADYARSMGIGDATVGDFADTLKGRSSLKDWLTEEVASELGEHQSARLTDNVLARVKDQERQVFKDAFDSGQYPVETRFPDADGNVVDVLKDARRAIDNIETPSAAIKNRIRDLEDAVEQGSDGVFDVQKLLETRSAIIDDTEAAFRNGSAQSGSALSSMQEVIDDAIEAALPPDKLARVQLARRRWRILKILERTTGSRSRENLGQINPGQFARDYRAMTPSYKRHNRATNDFEKILRTVDTMSVNRAHAGSTLIRGVAPTALKVGGGLAGAGLAGAIGANMVN